MVVAALGRIGGAGLSVKNWLFGALGSLWLLITLALVLMLAERSVDAGLPALHIAFRFFDTLQVFAQPLSKHEISIVLFHEPATIHRFLCIFNNLLLTANKSCSKSLAGSAHFSLSTK